MARQSLSVNSVGVTTWCAWNLLSAEEPGAGAELEEPLEGRFENSTMAVMSADLISGVGTPQIGLRTVGSEDWQVPRRIRAGAGSQDTNEVERMGAQGWT